MGWDIQLYVKCDNERVYIGDSFNYTHNCNSMIRSAGMGHWWGEEMEVLTAGQLGSKLQRVIARLEDSPKVFADMNPDNKWGSYETLLPILRKLTAVCATYPSAKIYASF